MKRSVELVKKGKERRGHAYKLRKVWAGLEEIENLAIRLLEKGK